MASSSTLDITFTSSSSSTLSPSSLSSSSSSTLTSTLTSTSTSTVSTHAVVSTITLSGISVTPAPTSSASSSTPRGHLSPGTIAGRFTAGLVIGGLIAGVVFGGCVICVLLMIRRWLRLRHRKAPPSTLPGDRLMHLERIRGHAAPPLREPYAIQNLPPSKNIRVLNWLERTGSAGPPSISQHTMNERDTNDDSRYHPVGLGQAPSAVNVMRSESTSESHYSQQSAQLAPISELEAGQLDGSEFRSSITKVD
ncbi:hypothetical protein D9757_009370 [Collybiopsis confluens]|uniref:Uncharacterized protein n=1 Tax=Collybiopsis confluens TaxID=2823264 RepID=A0A8H5H6L9_9AGAR|nr:hypothetical protein D9757_009370 [Collybiopsis confluens]